MRRSRRPSAPKLNGHDPLALDRWRLYAAMEESLRLHADAQATVQLNAYIVVPFVPRNETPPRCWPGSAYARSRLPARLAAARPARSPARRSANRWR